MKWGVSKGLIRDLELPVGSCINTWGVEFADSNSFFSIEEGIGLRCNENINHLDTQELSLSTDRIVTLSEGEFRVLTKDSLDEEGGVLRVVETTALKDAYLMDFVLRYRFKKEFVKSVFINGQELFHNSSNVYYEFDVSNVEILFKDESKACIRIIDCVIPKGMKQVMYARDQRGEWVIHCRLIPVSGEKEVIKICTSWAGTRSLPPFISKYILGVRVLRDFFWYKAEKRPYKSLLLRYLFNLSAYPMAHIKKDQMLKIRAEFRIIQ